MNRYGRAMLSSEDYRWFENRYLRAGELWDAVVCAIGRLWSPPLPQKVLEVGCASGRFLLWLYKGKHIPCGVEPSQELLEEARKNLPDVIQLWHTPIEDLPFEDKSFDTVFFMLSLEYAVDPIKALREAFRVARYTVIIVSFNAYSPSYWFAKFSAWVEKNPVVYCRTIRQSSLIAMTELAAGVPLHVTREPATWKEIGVGALIFSPIIVNRFDFTQCVAIRSSSPYRFVPSTAHSPYEGISLQNRNVHQRGAKP